MTGVASVTVRPFSFDALAYAYETHRELRTEFHYAFQNPIVARILA